MVLGGVDNDGPKLYTIAPHGSTDMLPFVTMGSGSLAAMAVFESRWRPGLSLDEGKTLVRDAIAAGVFNDLGSGNNIDLCVITKDDQGQVGAQTASLPLPTWTKTTVSVNYLRPYDEANLKGVRSGDYSFKKGATSVLTSRTIPLVIDEVMIRSVTEEVESMDTN